MKPKLKICLELRLGFVGGGLLLSLAAGAQYAPDATVDLGAGYGQLGMSQSIMNGTRALNPPSSSPLQPSTPPKARPSRSDMEAAWKRLEPEYRQRIRTNGKPSADAWLAAKARETGQQAGREARKR